ncbi:unnamed protein product [Clavelina lepadiformis]|uniref:DUF6729 domain-containing protein n=1 Tax=Clavelina lepadiformis TaxID=159417 RepID=A0ABP0FSF1_CLALP
MTTALASLNLSKSKEQSGADYTRQARWWSDRGLSETFSPSTIQHQLQEQHSQSWVERVINYFDDCKRHKDRSGRFGRSQHPDDDKALPLKDKLRASRFLCARARYF